MDIEKRSRSVLKRDDCEVYQTGHANEILIIDYDSDVATLVTSEGNDTLDLSSKDKIQDKFKLEWGFEKYPYRVLKTILHAGGVV